ncbi:MAG: CpsD/CapB family tyrosine-protein kinase [Deltaproteobacteria bacterium]|nr:CpsD/CapB family tyrosine-protein kinase [Deltaproteobacteria bacterium]MBW2445007.1 CpsD/CapB family tyrosine-protein kinase [Deltaproteobacteria bacterium]
MGKVYDALRKAEGQRARRVETATAMPGHEWERPIRARDQEKPSLWRRLFSRGKAVAETPEQVGAPNKRRISMLQPDSFVAEQFRTLRARIDSISQERPVRTITMTSARKGEGKTISAVNFALVTAMSVGRRVLLVDCDMREPEVHRTLGLRPETGLAEVLTDQASLDDAIIKVDGINLEVLPVRALPPNPSELLASPKMRQVVEELARNYDTVILDAPSTLDIPDAKSVSELTDGLLLVVRADKTPEEDVEAALDVLDRRRILGLVLNDAHMASTNGYTTS